MFLFMFLLDYVNHLNPGAETSLHTETVQERRLGGNNGYRGNLSPSGQERALTSPCAEAQGRLTPCRISRLNFYTTDIQVCINPSVYISHVAINNHTH